MVLSPRQQQEESLSDVDDGEIDAYLHGEKERLYKKIIWKLMNRDYLREQGSSKKRNASAAGEEGRKRKRADEPPKAGRTRSHSGRVVGEKVKDTRSRVNYDALDALYYLDGDGRPPEEANESRGGDSATRADGGDLQRDGHEVYDNSFGGVNGGEFEYDDYQSYQYEYGELANGDDCQYD